MHPPTVAVRAAYGRDGYYIELVSHPALGAWAAALTGAEWVQASRPVDDRRAGLTSFIDRPQYCPVIYRRPG